MLNTINIKLAGVAVTLPVTPVVTAKVNALAASPGRDNQAKIDVYINNMGYDSSVVAGTFDVLLVTTLIDVFNKLDFVSLDLSKRLFDVAGTADVLSKTYVKILISNVTTSDVMLQNEVEGLATVSLLSDSLTTHVVKAFVETPALYEQLIRSVVKTLRDQATVVDTISRAVDKPRVDSIGTVDSARKAAGLVKLDIVQSAEALFRGVAKSTTTIVVAPDTASLATLKPVATDSVIGSDLLTREPTVVVVSQGTLSDSFNRVASYRRTHSEALTSTDVAAKQFSKSIYDTLSAIDLLLDTKLSQTYLPPQADNSSASDLVFANVGKGVVTPLSVAEELSFALQLAVTDTATALSTLQTALARVDSTSATDETAPFDTVSLSLLLSALENLASTDEMKLTLLRPLADSVAATQALTLALVNSQIDQVNPAESLELIYAKRIDDTFNIADVFEKEYLKQLSDVFSSSDSGGVYTNTYFAEDYAQPTYNATLRSSF